MAKATGKSNDIRIPITYFSGINSTVQSSLSLKTELSHAENARAPIIGVLEKRAGQTVIGTEIDGTDFNTTANYGLAQLDLTDEDYQGVFRISATVSGADTSSSASVSPSSSTSLSPSASRSPSTSESASASPSASPDALSISTYDSVTITEPAFQNRVDNDTYILDSTSGDATIYSLTEDDKWRPLSDSSATGLIGSMFDFATVEDSLALVNGKDYNRMIANDGATVTDSTEAGSFFNSPRAEKVAYYKSRIYLANYKRDGISYKTNVLRSSYPLGIVALIDGDVAAASADADSRTITLTDTKYFYTDTGMKTYDVYRGGTLITTLTVTTVNEASVAATSAKAGVANAKTALLSSDEVWVAGTYSGAKQYRWINNPTTTGKDVKQYDTFKLSGGSESGVTLFEPVGNVLMIGNKNTMATWDDYSLKNFDTGIGCTSKKGSVKLMGTLFYIHYSGIYSTTGGASTLISRKIERYISGATKTGLESAAAGFKGMSIFFTIGDVTLYKPDGSTWKTLSDVCLECNVADKNWYVHTNVPADALMNFINSAGREQLLMTDTRTNHEVMEFLSGSTDDSAEIFFRADTQEIQLMGDFEKIAHPTKVITNLDRGSLMETMVSLDGNDFYTIEGTNRKGASTLKITARDKSMIQPVSCRKLKLSFREFSKQRCRLTQAAVVLTPTLESFKE